MKAPCWSCGRDMIRHKRTYAPLRITLTANENMRELADGICAKCYKNFMQARLPELDRAAQRFMQEVVLMGQTRFYNKPGRKK